MINIMESKPTYQKKIFVRRTILKQVKVKLLFFLRKIKN